MSNPIMVLLSPTQMRIRVWDTDKTEHNEQLVDVRHVSGKALPFILSEILSNFPKNIEYGALEFHLKILRSLNDIGITSSQDSSDRLRRHILSAMDTWYVLAKTNIELGKIKPGVPALGVGMSSAEVPSTITVDTNTADRYVTLRKGSQLSLESKNTGDSEDLTKLKAKIAALKTRLETECATGADDADCKTKVLSEVSDPNWPAL